MSEHDFLSIGIPLGTSRLTISASSVGGAIKFLNDLNEVDEVDPEGLSPIDSVLDHINTINAAVVVKMPNMAPSAPAASNSAPAQQGNPNVKTCQHGAMIFRQGTSNRTGNAYKGWFCPAPRGTNQCPAVFDN